MKTMLTALLLVAVSQTAPVFAGQSKGSPLAGHWVLEVDKLPMPVEARPKHVALDFQDAGSGRWVSRVEIVDQNNNRMYSESTLSLDGTPGQASGTYWVDVCSAKMPARNVLVMQFAYKGVPSSTRVYSVDESAKTLTETEAYFKDGAPVMRTATFTRTHSKP